LVSDFQEHGEGEPMNATLVDACGAIERSNTRLSNDVDAITSLGIKIRMEYENISAQVANERDKWCKELASSMVLLEERPADR